MTSTLQLEVLDLRHFSARQLQPLLEEESRLWRKRLLWDYTQSTHLLLDYMDSRILPGYAALDHGNIRGYSFSVYEGNKAILGDVFASEAGEPTAREVESQLLAHSLPVLQHTPGVERIESQLLLHPSGRHANEFHQAGFQIYPRLFMICDLETLRARTRIALDRPPLDMLLRTWQATDLQLAADLIVRGYHDHLDSLINNQYLSASGAARFLHNIVQYPGCGAFDAGASWLCLDQPTGRMQGMLLCSLVSEESAHITQLCVAPEFRRQGMALHLTAHCAAALQRKSLRQVTLTVTEANHGAIQLYERMGFRVHHRFDAMVWTK
jgi:ribosomal protein S18 acetylase RimI-like enzyme